MKLFVLTLLICSFAVDQTEGNLSSILKHLSSRALLALKTAKLSVLKAQLDILRSHIQSLLSFFKGREGDIPIKNTNFVLHFVADRCYLIGKRFILSDYKRCKTSVTEKETGLSGTCLKRTQAESIECASQKVLNLLILLKAMLQKPTSLPPAELKL